MEAADLARLIEEAVAAQRVVTPETVETVWEPLRRAAKAGPAAVEAGLGMLHDPDRDVRAAGCDLLAECVWSASAILDDASNNPAAAAARVLAQLASET